MDRSSGLKECPRCGLRNRQGAYQCDFCGWDFKAASDDWMGQVNDLERIGMSKATTQAAMISLYRLVIRSASPANVLDPSCPVVPDLRGHAFFPRTGHWLLNKSYLGQQNRTKGAAPHPVRERPFGASYST